MNVYVARRWNKGASNTGEEKGMVSEATDSRRGWEERSDDGIPGGRWEMALHPSFKTSAT